MPRPSAERKEASNYPWHVDIPPRFGDLDPQRHLNNAALARFYEDGRVRFVDTIGVRAALEPGCGFVVAEVVIQYLAEGRYPAVVTASAGLLRLGRSSLTIGQALFQGGGCIGAGESTLVYVRRSEGGPRPLPEGARALLLAYRLTIAADDIQPAQENSREVTHA